MKLSVCVQSGSYDILFKKGGIKDIAALWGEGEKTLVVTDTGVPAEYARCVATACKKASIVTLPQGEEHKNTDSLAAIWRGAVQAELTRSDRIIAVGGGVVGDMAGFAAATYMRGIDFYNIPTTLLSQVDSSVGGKTAVDFEGYKNIVGAFWQPKGVLIDTDTLHSLPRRHIVNGLAEVIKMAATYDAAFCKSFLSEDYMPRLEQIVYRALDIKKGVVERDEKESGERKVLNFGHTFGHALESKLSFGTLLHGECVALGTLLMCAPDVRDTLTAIYKKVGLPTRFPLPPASLSEHIRHDKKCVGDKVSVIYVPRLGSYEIKTLGLDEILG